MSAPFSASSPHNLLDDLPALLTHCRSAARRAGGVTLQYFGAVESERKQDGSPVTVADRAAEAIIIDALHEVAPDIPIVAEEAVAAGDIPHLGDGPFWLVDPLDGTKEFIRAVDEYTVNIALIVDRRPVLGVVYAPARQTDYAGLTGHGAVRSTDGGPDDAIQARRPPEAGLTVLTSRSHRDINQVNDFLAPLEVSETLYLGSSLKLCLLADGTADIYPRFGRTCEWDIAAGHAVLAAAGGRLTQVDGKPFIYGKPDFLNGPFIAYGAPD